MELLEAGLDGFNEDVGDLIVPRRVDVLKKPPPNVDFLRDYVSRHTPVVIRGLIDEWPALERWQDDAYLSEQCGESKVKTTTDIYL